MSEILYVVDDDVAVRDSLALLIELRGFQMRACANAEEFLQTYDPSTPACALIDVRMPGMSGLELFEEVRRRGWTVPCIIMSAYGDVAMTRAALKAGAVDFLEKPIDDADVLIDVIQHALSIGARQRQELASAQDAQQRLQRLTRREREVMDLLVEGYSNRQIGDLLAISPRTVEVYKARLFEKLQLRSITDLVRFSLGPAALTSQSK